MNTNVVKEKFKGVNKILLVFLLVFSLGVVAIMSDEQKQLSYMYGDMSVYICQAYSFAYDGDNIFDENDLDRFIKEVYSSGPAGLIINENTGTYYFSKPYVYGAVLAPFVLIFGLNGIIVCNWLLLLAIILMTYHFFNHTNNKRISIVTSIVFWVFSFAIAYVFVAYVDIFLAFLTCSILFSYFKYSVCEDDVYHHRSRQIWLFICSLLIGVSVFQRVQFIFLSALIFIDLMIVKKKFKDSIILFIAALFSFAILTLFQFLQTGYYSSYVGNRYYILSFPDGLNTVIEDLTMRNTSLSESGIVGAIWESVKHPKDLLYNILCYFIGKQTGIFVYAPFTLCAISLWSKKSVKKYWYAIGFGMLYASFFFVQNPGNYYGGGQSFGNRYFLQVMPIVIWGIDEINIKREKVIGTISIALCCLTLSGMLTNPKMMLARSGSYLYRESLSIFPYEWNAFDGIKAMTPAPKIEKEDMSVILINTYGEEVDGGIWTRAKEDTDLYIQSKDPFDTVIINAEFYENNEMKSGHLVFHAGHVIHLSSGYYVHLSINPPYEFYPSESCVTSDSRGLGIRIIDIKLSAKGIAPAMYRYGDGFYNEEREEVDGQEFTWRWADKEANIEFDNYYSADRAGFIIDIVGYQEKGRTIHVSGCGIDEDVVLKKGSTTLQLILDFKEGNILTFTSDAESEIPSSEDNRMLNFMVLNAQIVQDDEIDNSISFSFGNGF